MNKPIIIAEAGWNAGGNLDINKKIIEAAAKAGADFVKFQTWSVDRLKPGSWDKDGRREIYKKAELSMKDHEVLIKLCEENEVEFLSSVFSIQDAELLLDLGRTVVKIPSFESRNKELVHYCANFFDTVIMSTGTSTLEEIKETLVNCNMDKFFLMHCISAYPLNPLFANLPRINDLKTMCPRVGYSDHMEGIESVKIAMEYGIDIVEKHFTIDNNLPGRDNKFAILPNQLQELTDYMDLRELMQTYHGSGFSDIEQDSRDNYTGRFDG